mgnify:CR=1 FL=1
MGSEMCIRDSMNKTPRSKSTSAARSVVRSLMQILHDDLTAAILEPLDHRIREAISEDAIVVWTTCQAAGLTPWRYCLDRYCDCKIVLHEHEPPKLPGLGTLGSDDGSWGATAGESASR